MKMFKCTLIAMLITVASCGQQGLEVGAAFGLPTGDARFAVAANFVVEGAYWVNLADKVALGPKVGYSSMSGDEVVFSDFLEDAPNQNYLTVAAAGLIEFADRFWAGADIGYGFGANGFDQNDQIFGIPIENVNGFYYSPRLRYRFSDRLNIEAAYRSILIDDYDASSVTVGVNIQLVK
ncbi:outer membrane beta-barrel protein [Gilvibacter sp.]|uniref:outer membrane beta-barrel protein n=1 Tax=Gilvibacter sp. TaxID=2729997 RepID=UPI0035BE287C